MGATGAQGMADAVAQGQASLRQALSWHLGSNHFPPIHSSFIPVAERAIELANEEGWDETITMPNGVTLRVGDIVEQLHLGSFLAQDDDGDFEGFDDIDDPSTW